MRSKYSYTTCLLPLYRSPGAVAVLGTCHCVIRMSQTRVSSPDCRQRVGHAFLYPSRCAVVVLEMSTAAEGLVPCPSWYAPHWPLESYIAKWNRVSALPLIHSSNMLPLYSHMLRADLPARAIVSTLSRDTLPPAWYSARGSLAISPPAKVALVQV